MSDLASALLAAALAVTSLPPFDPHKADEAKLRAVQAEAETQRAITKAWIARTRGDKYTLQRKGGPDEATIARVEVADRMWADRIRLVQLEFSTRRARRVLPAASSASAGVERERDEAREASRRLAAEVERLQNDLADAKKSSGDARRHRAFYESARFILAESTFKRIDDKARALLASVSTKGAS